MNYERIKDQITERWKAACLSCKPDSKSTSTKDGAQRNLRRHVPHILKNDPP
jgi:hypothetical protein